MGLPIETQEEFEELTCPKCGSKLESKGGIGHSCYFDNNRQRIRSHLFRCAWCNLEVIIPVSKDLKKGAE